jgi:hypothetical protein
MKFFLFHTLISMYQYAGMTITYFMIYKNYTLAIFERVLNRENPLGPNWKPVKRCEI